MNQAFKLGFPHFHSFPSTRFAVIPKKLKVRALVFLNRSAVGPQRPLSELLAKSSKAMSMEPSPEMGGPKEKIVKSRMVETDRVGNDPDVFERMTVQELRAKLRSNGIPAKGCKRDLVSALKSFINNTEGDDSQLIVEDELSSKLKENNSEKGSKRKAKNVSTNDHPDTLSTVLKVSRLRQKKGRAEKTPVLDEDSFGAVESSVSSIVDSIPHEQHAQRNARTFSTKEHTEDVTTILKSSTGRLHMDNVSVKKSVKVKRTGTKQISPVTIGAYDKVDLFESKIEPWTIFAHKKPQKGWIAYNPKTMRPPTLSKDVNHVKLMSWNVNGLRALLKLEGFSALELAQREDFDVLCLQETKLQEKDVEAIKQTLLEGYGNSYWTCSVSKLGYSGTAIISRIPPLSVRYGLGISDHDSEGRLVTAEFDTFYLLCGYVPNSGDGLKRLSYRVTEWDPSLASYIKELEKSKPVILTGDLNCAHEEIDIYNPDGNKRSAGFTIEERNSFETNLLNNGFVDTFRKQHPGVVGYTYWGYRHGGRKTNKGWRLDYFLVSESIAENVHDSYILPDVTGSDHSPIGLILKL